jgi:hypothetical protein
MVLLSGFGSMECNVMLCYVMLMADIIEIIGAVLPTLLLMCERVIFVKYASFSK